MEYLSFVNLKSFPVPAQEVCKVLELSIIWEKLLRHNQSWS